MAELEQLRKAKAAKSLKHSRSEYGLLVVADRSPSDDGSNQNADLSAEVTAVIKVPT